MQKRIISLSKEILVVHVHGNIINTIGFIKYHAVQKRVYTIVDNDHNHSQIFEKTSAVGDFSKLVSWFSFLFDTFQQDSWQAAHRLLLSIVFRHGAISPRLLSFWLAQNRSHVAEETLSPRSNGFLKFIKIQRLI